MLTIEEKIDFIKKQSEKHEISAYEFWKEGGLSQMTAHNILNGNQYIAGAVLMVGYYQHPSFHLHYGLYIF